MGGGQCVWLCVGYEWWSVCVAVSSVRDVQCGLLCVMLFSVCVAVYFM